MKEKSKEITLRRGQKLTVKEAFEQFENVDIQLVWQTPCAWCGSLVEENDIEYSFAGTKEEFEDNQGGIELNEEIKYITNDSVFDTPIFRYYRYSTETTVCPMCCELGLENCFPND